MSQSISIERAGARVYFGGNTYTVKDRIKALGGHWDADRRQWWVGAKKLAQAEALVAELACASTPASAVAAASVGLVPDAPAGVVADALDEAGRAKDAAAVRRPKQDPHDIRLTGKGRYKGREYYAGAVTKDGARVRLLTLPDANGNYLDFWADCSQVEQTKRYEPREVWDGRRYSGRTRTVHTTLGSIADFIRDQRQERQAGTPACPVCGVRGRELVHDLETGMNCCRGCCDMPAE